jgi:two-component system NarL family response regulator
MKIMVVDDHVFFREGLVALIKSESNLEVVGEAGTIAEAVALAAAVKPDLVLLDYSMPDGSGPTAARKILALRPDASIVFLTIHDGDSHLLEAIRSGAIGLLVKDVSFKKLLESIQAVALKQPVLSHTQTLRLMHEFTNPGNPVERGDANLDDLTTREIEILRDLAVDASNREIARRLSISVATVKNNIHFIFHKLHLKNRKEVARFARHQGLGKNNRNNLSA